jgi:hypothetical protein
MRPYPGAWHRRSRGDGTGLDVLLSFAHLAVWLNFILSRCEFARRVRTYGPLRCHKQSWTISTGRFRPDDKLITSDGGHSNKMKTRSSRWQGDEMKRNAGVQSEFTCFLVLCVTLHRIGKSSDGPVRKCRPERQLGGTAAATPPLDAILQPVQASKLDSACVPPHRMSRRIQSKNSNCDAVWNVRMDIEKCCAQSLVARLHLPISS